MSISPMVVWSVPFHQGYGADCVSAFQAASGERGISSQTLV